MNGNQDIRAVTIEQVRDLGRGGYVIEYKRFFDFKAGQIVSIARRPEDDPRMYSIASGESDENVRILFSLVTNGKLTPYLAGLKAGDTLWSSAGFGKFTGSDGPSWLIAQGTGIAPFASMLRSGQASGKMVIHGARYLDSFFFSEELQAAVGGNYVRCCTGEEAPGVFRGRVTDYLSGLDSLPAEPLYYLCGSAEMVVDTRDILIRRGIPFNRIISEIYF